jgi:hypothetical protein
MELTPSFVALLQDFTPVFTTPTFTTFVQIVTGWVFSQRHRFITELQDCPAVSAVQKGCYGVTVRR